MRSRRDGLVVSIIFTFVITTFEPKLILSGYGYYMALSQFWKYLTPVIQDKTRHTTKSSKLDNNDVTSCSFTKSDTDG